MKMSNQDMIEKLKGIIKFQERENEYFKKTGKKMLQGRVKITYALEKNKEILRSALRPYSNTLDSLNEEYRDVKAEKEAMKEEISLAKKERREVRDIPVFMKEGKALSEYMSKLSDLKEIESDIVVYNIDVCTFDGLDLDSFELGLLMFMIK